MKSLLRVIALLRPFSSEVLLSIVLGVATISAGIGLMSTAAYLIASAALHPSIAELQVAIVGVRFFGISRGVFRYLERLVSHSLNLRLVSRLRVDFYRRIEPGAPANLRPYRSGDLLGRSMADLETLENLYVRVIAPALVALVITLGVSLFAGGYLAEIGLVLASGLFINGFLLPGLTLVVSKPQTEELSRERAGLYGGIVETLQGYEDLQANNAQSRWFTKVQERVHRAGAIQNRLGWINGINSGLLLLVTNLTLLLVLWVAVPVVAAGELPGVSLAVITLLVISSFEATATLPAAAQQFNASLSAARRLFEIDSREEFTSISTLPPGERVEFRDVNFTYGEGLPNALESINFTLIKGKKVAIVGPSGSGKTSLVQLLLKFHEPQQGQILLDGVAISDVAADEVRKRFGVITQSAHIFNSSLRENLQLAKPGAPDDELEQALERAELADWYRSQADGLSTWMGENGVRLSAGEKQRVAVARLHLHDPPFLLLDEPTANLDPLTGRQVVQDLLEEAENKGILWITHRLDLLKNWDLVLVIENGRIVEWGSYAELLQSGGIFAAMVRIERDLLDPLINETT